MLKLQELWSCRFISSQYRFNKTLIKEYYYAVVKEYYYMKGNQANKNSSTGSLLAPKEE